MKADCRNVNLNGIVRMADLWNLPDGVVREVRYSFNSGLLYSVDIPEGKESKLRQGVVVLAKFHRLPDWPWGIREFIEDLVYNYVLPPEFWVLCQVHSTSNS
jgi:hypothetical protein